MTPAQRLARAGTATIGEAAPQTRVIKAPIRPLAPGTQLAGPVRTVRCCPGDNLALHRMLAVAGEGEVVVVDYGGSIDSGPFGEVMAIACQVRGIAGLVIDGAVRDTARMIDLGFPVFARGRNIRGTSKVDPGEIDGTLQIGGVAVEPGDFLVADDDAVIIVPATVLGQTLTAADARLAAEARLLEGIRAGETTMHLLGLDKESAP